VLAPADEPDRGPPFTPSDAEPQREDGIDDATRPPVAAIALREAARLALRRAGDADRRLASPSPDRLRPRAPGGRL